MNNLFIKEDLQDLDNLHDIEKITSRINELSEEIENYKENTTAIIFISYALLSLIISSYLFYKFITNMGIGEAIFPCGVVTSMISTMALTCIKKILNKFNWFDKLKNKFFMSLNSFNKKYNEEQQLNLHLQSSLMNTKLQYQIIAYLDNLETKVENNEHIPSYDQNEIIWAKNNLIEYFHKENFEDARQYIVDKFGKWADIKIDYNHIIKEIEEEKNKANLVKNYCLANNLPVETEEEYEYEVGSTPLINLKSHL